MAGSTCLFNLKQLQFVEVSLQDFTCPICLEVLDDPFVTDCCGYHFCKQCINSAMRRRNECPLCKAQPVQGVNCFKDFTQELDEAWVYCSQKPQGCGWAGQYIDLGAHVSLGQLNGQCHHVMLNCPNKNCSVVLSRIQMKHHVNNCKYRPFTCLHCGHKDTYTDVTSSHYQGCLEYPIVCPNNCTKNKIKRNQLQKHLDVCPNMMVACPFSQVGCKTNVKRINKKEHIESNVTVHQALILASITELKNENKTMKEECTAKLDSSSQLETKICFLENKYYQLQEELEGAGGSKVDKTHDHFHFLHTKYAELKDNYSSVCRDNTQLQNSLHSLQFKYNTLEAEVNKLKCRFGAYPQQTSYNAIAELNSRISTLSHQHNNVDYWIHGYQLMAEETSKHRWKLYLRMMAESATQLPDCTSPIITKIANYRECKQSGESSAFVTSSFYTAGQGGKYKMCLTVCFGAVDGPYMSMMASLMMGEYDASLSWPFRGSIIVTVLNQLTNSEHYTKEIWSVSDNPGLVYSGRPSSCWGPPWGRRYFIDHSVMECREALKAYVMDDCFFLKVQAVSTLHTVQHCLL